MFCVDNIATINTVINNINMVFYFYGINATNAKTHYFFGILCGIYLSTTTPTAAKRCQ